MEEVLSKHSEPKDLNSVVGNYLYITVLLQESTGGISQEAEFTAVKFVKSPYRLSLVSTAPFIKPGLPFNIQVLVKDHLDKPVDRIRVRLVERQLWRQGDVIEDLPCPDSSISQSDGLAVFICNTPPEAIKTVLKFETADTALPAASQASLTLEAKAYHSPNERYLYIDPPMPSQGLHVGQYANIKVFSATPSYIPVQSLSFLVLSKGKVVDFGTVRFTSRADPKTTVSFLVTSAMAPSIRLLVYYILYGEGTSELVADSVWLDVRDKCVSGLQTELSYQRRDYKPKQNLQLDIRTNHEGLVALSAVDSGLYTLRPNYRDPVTMVLRHIEQSDQGCGGGGGKDSADVFRLAGLTFLTNANAHPSASNEPCTALVRPKRALSEEEKTKKAESFGQLKICCEWGMRHIPKSVTCTQFSKQLKKVRQPCRDAFKECCEFIQQDLDRDPHLILGRHDLGADFDLAPSLVRTSFPESWLWEVQRASGGPQSVTRTLPDSLTTWEIKAVGMFKTGMCVSDPIQVSVNLPLSVDVPLPYQVVRGEQLELSGSVYNQQTSKVKYCVTLTAGPAFCLLQSRPVAGEEGLHSTTCEWRTLLAGEVGKVTFTLLGLEPGEHTLTFTLKTPEGNRDIVTKTLRVEPEGVKQEDYSGGRLDPQGLYGSEKREVRLKNEPPPNIVPNTAVERLLTINGEVLGEVMSVMHNPDGLRQLINLPEGSAEAESGTLIPLVQVFLYLESTGSWDVLGDDIQKNARDMKQKIKEGVISITSFRGGDSSYSMWMKREPSTWVTALMVKTLSAVDQVFSVDHQELSDSVTWLIQHTQQPDGSFREKSAYKPKMMAEGTDEVEQSVYLTSFVLIALKKATSIRDRILQLRFQDNSMKSAVAYISQHALTVKSVYVRAIATYALTLHDPNDATASHLFNGLERLAQQKGNPVVRRYWKEPSETADWLKPDQSSGRTVEMTAYILLTVLLKGRIPYANPILSWLTQDQHYGEGFYSVQDTVLTLEAVTEYSRVIPRAVLSQHINIRYSRKGPLAKVQLNQTRTVATPIEVKKDDDIIVSTGYGRGVSNVKIKTVYYQTTPPSSQSCNFDITIEMVGPDTNSRLHYPHLLACAKYKPPPNEDFTESGLTVMKIQLPTGVEGYLEDLKQFRDTMPPLISHFEQKGTTVIIQMDSVPSDNFLCVGFRTRTGFRVGGVSESLFSVFEPQDKGSMCTKQFSYQEQRLQRLCVGDQCQCMTAACAAYRGKLDLTLTIDKRTKETCKPNIKYAYRVNVRSITAEGDFTTFTATVAEVLKNTDKAFDAVTSGTEVELVKKITCSSVDVQQNKQYLVMGSRGSEVTLGRSVKYRFPLDSEAVVELLPTDCSSPDCLDHISVLDEFALELQLSGCPDAS